MKNNIMKRIFIAVFAVLLLMGGFSVTAYAGGGEATNDSNVKTEEKKEEKRRLPRTVT